MTLETTNKRFGARPVRTHQAGAVPGSLPRRSLTNATGGTLVPSCGVRGRTRRATDQRKIYSKQKQQPQINIMQWNAEGVSNKREELQHFLHENNVNICCIEETHLQEDKLFKIRGYQVFRSDRKERKKGGVMTLVRNNINALETKTFMEEAEYLEVKANIGQSSINIVNFYCPNDKKLSLDTMQIPESTFLIVGDFNSQSHSWGYNTIDKRGETIEDWQDENHLILVNDPTDTPTFYSRRWHTTTTPDLAFCTDDIHQKISRKVCDQLGGSDHRPVMLSIAETTTPVHAQLPRWNYKKANWSKFEARTNEITRDIEIEGKNINNVVKALNTGILKAAKDSIPRGVRKDYKPYWSNEIQATHDALTQAREDAELNPSQENNIKLQKCKAKHLRTKLECQRKGWREKTSSMDMEKDTKKLWNLTKALNDEGSKGEKITLLVEGQTATGKDAANEFAKGYEAESNTDIPISRKKEVRTELRERLKAPTHEIMQKDITMYEMKAAIRKMKKKKAPGPDNITNEMLQHLGNLALKTLLDILNLSWRQGQVPQCWKEAIMMPILKRGKNKSKASSYRPISLTSSCCKLMERIINKRLQTYLESERILGHEQAGFRQYRSTEDQTTHLSQVVEDAFQYKKVTLAVFVDLQRAFDKVWKDGLLVKLLRVGVSGRMYKWSKSYLYNRRARVLIDGKCGRKILLKQGVPQGGVLPPTLFILFMNDLVPELPNGIHSALYADDLVLWCSEEYAATARYRIQTALDMVAAWAKEWCVTINREKTTATLFTLSPKTQSVKLTMDNSPILMEDQQTYLGVTFDKRLTWKQHITTAEAKARRKLNIMRKLAGTNWGANEKVLKSVYQGNVRPHLEYGSSAWLTAAKTHHQTLDKVQNQALRIITGAMKSTPIASMEEITNIPPLSKRRECKAMIQAVKYQCLQDHPMNQRLTKLSSGRLKRSSFTLETRSLHRKHQEQLPKHVKPIDFSMNDNLCVEKEDNVTIQTTVPLLTAKDEQSNIARMTITMSMLEEQYPSESWVRVYTDGSATNATTKGGAGIYIEYPNGERQSKAIPTGRHCSNYKAEEEALIHATHVIKEKADNTRVVFLSDALSVLQALTNNKLPQLESALYSIKSLKTVVQWIPSHCGVIGNENADKLAKEGAGQQQEDNPVCYTEMKTIIKSLHNTPQQQDSYHQLKRSEQTTIFRLRTGHNRLNKHLHRVLKVIPSPMCPCGEAEQDTEHFLQTCKSHQALRTKIWETPTTIRDKLYGLVEALQKTARFVEETGIQV